MVSPIRSAAKGHPAHPTPQAIHPSRNRGAGATLTRFRFRELHHLQVLRHSGILDRISGTVVGVPRGIGGLEPGASPALAEIVLDVLGDRDVPVLGNVEFGHAGPNLPMPVGVRVGLDAQQRTLSRLSRRSASWRVLLRVSITVRCGATSVRVRTM
ncbi:hypothetical protein ACGFZP_31290 [Kitasatospora sp. NPDC048239]|uniref:hypothetical protein n=1 Tax=Kitasatospora sp. NPDC048239 TaxID=3364046 RepID=UPI003721240D